MAATLPEDQRLANLSPKAYEHPADRAATAALHRVPMLDTVVRRLVELGYERALRQALLAGAVKLGDDQLPDVWAHHRAACARLDLPGVPDLYLAEFPIANAAAIGSGRPMVVLNSRTLELLDDAGVRTVLGHEAGHILSDHVLYRTALVIVLSLGDALRLPVLGGLPLTAVRLALLEWFRASELSCDRAATLVTRDPLATCRTLMALAGGAAARRLDLEAFMRQASEYEDWDSGWDRISRLRMELGATHAYPVRRVSELMRWIHSGEYDRVLGGQYPRRDQAGDPRAYAGEAAEHYAERFRSFFRDASGQLERSGDRLSEAAERLADWLRPERERG
jgi:Zn-dependent protease with chaperone function